MTSDKELREKARKRAEEKVGFYTHLGVYVAVNIFLIAIWYVSTGPGSFPWFVFPLFGWGIGIVGHGVSTFYGESYIDEKAEEEYKKLKEQES